MSSQHRREDGIVHRNRREMDALEKVGKRRKTTARLIKQETAI